MTTAQLAHTLRGAGPFTVFAPTDDAFGAVPPEVLSAILSNVTALQEVLLYHVVPGTQCSAGLTSGPVATINGDDVQVAVGSPGVKVNNAHVVDADVSVGNGVVHVIDQVLIPPRLVPYLLKALNF